WFKGNTYQIKWTPSGCQETDYKINIFKGSVDTENFKLQLMASGVTQKSWTIPGTFEAGTYVIRVKAENTCIGDSEKFEIKSKYMINPEIFKKPVKKPQFKPPKGFFKPVVESILTIPLGALKPGVQLFVKGKKFGPQKGRILIKGNFPGGHIELENVTWVSDSKVNGFVPQSANGQPNQIVSVVVVSKFNFKSDPFGSPWFYGREEKWLVLGDASCLHCGDDGNFNACNKLSPDGSICTAESVICGFHKNSWGAVGNDSGTDSYLINLKNGWVFKSMTKAKWKKTSADEVLKNPNPPLPVGANTWTTAIEWVVTPNDHVVYQIKVLVEGPIGTHYK
ncbi:MAG: hypothetical protein ABFR36_05135, partial [Acidobacteriota bacterium]